MASLVASQQDGSSFRIGSSMRPICAVFICFPSVCVGSKLLIGLKCSFLYWLSGILPQVNPTSFLALKCVGLSFWVSLVLGTLNQPLMFTFHYSFNNLHYQLMTKSWHVMSVWIRKKKFFGMWGKHLQKQNMIKYDYYDLRLLVMAAVTGVSGHFLIRLFSDL